jgi:glutathione S-transferase
MAEADLTLYAESTWMSPWVFHVMVALEEKGLPYKLEVASIPMSAEQKKELQDKAILGKVPVLVHGDLWISESLAISEYIAEKFPYPASPRIFPADLGQRARARQVMSYCRTSLMGLREDRPTSSVFGRPTVKPMTEKGKADAADLVRVATALIKPGAKNLFDEWCIADADFALMLMRMVANEDPLPQHVIDYALAQFDRKSVKRYIAHLPTRP